MKEYKDYYREYADLLTGFGAGLMPGNLLVLEIEPENYEFAKYMVESAARRGCEDVVVVYTDPAVDCLRAEYGAEGTLEKEKWKEELIDRCLSEGGIDISFVSPHPVLFEGTSTAVRKSVIAYQNRLRNTVRRSIWRGQNWLYAALPNKDWAKYIYPDMEPEKALATLWNELFSICMIDGSGSAESRWIELYDRNYRRINWLRSLDIDIMHAYNSLGTDIRVGLHRGAGWIGGADKESRYPGQCQCNIPSYEIATTPDRLRIDGIVCASMPLNINGGMVEGMKLEIKDGRIVSYDAQAGLDILEHIIESEENMHYLGEFAIVEAGNPIEQSGVVFCNTLLDENAACHMAIGMGIPDPVPGAEGKSDEELIAMGVNVAGMHIDFMFGTSDTCIDAVCADGSIIPVLHDGKYIGAEK